jgi:hypothetical protein
MSLLANTVHPTAKVEVKSATCSRTAVPVTLPSRRLTVSYFVPNSTRRNSVRAPEPMPYVRLLGRWLDRAGFPIGARLHVQVQRGRLVLEVAPEELAEQ